MRMSLVSLIMASILPCILTLSFAENSLKAGEYMDCEAFSKSLTDGVLALHQTKRAPPMTELLLDLSTKQCRIELQEPANNELAPGRIYERFKKSVVMLGSIYKCSKCSKWHTSTASGFLVTKAGAVVTNYHVVDHPDHVAMGAITSEGRIFAVKKILAADKASDVAIVQLDGSGFQPMALMEKVPVGSRVFVIGHPGNRPYTFSQGIVSGYFLSKDAEEKEKAKRMTITADYGVGSSGGPVIDEFGNATGIVASTHPVMGGCEHNHYAQMIFKDCVPSESILALIKK